MTSPKHACGAFHRRLQQIFIVKCLQSSLAESFECQRSHIIIVKGLQALGAKWLKPLKWTHSLLASIGDLCPAIFHLRDQSCPTETHLRGFNVCSLFIFKISNPGVAMNLWISPQKNVVSWRRGASGLAFLPSPPCSENPTAPAWTVLQCPGPNGRRVHFGSVLETRHIAYD